MTHRSVGQSLPGRKARAVTVRRAGPDPRPHPYCWVREDIGVAADRACRRESATAPVARLAACGRNRSNGDRGGCASRGPDVATCRCDGRPRVGVRDAVATVPTTSHGGARFRGHLRGRRGQGGRRQGAADPDHRCFSVGIGLCPLPVGHHAAGSSRVSGGSGRVAGQCDHRLPRCHRCRVRPRVAAPDRRSGNGSPLPAHRPRPATRPGSVPRARDPRP